MSSRGWLVATTGTILILAGLIAAGGYAVDPYGMMRDPSRRKLAVYFHDRKAKFFLSKRYVPVNYGGLMIGASEIANWDVPTLAGAKVYNESVQGASISEERFFVRQALDTGHFKLAVVVLSPPLSATHDFKDGLDGVQESEFIGSIHAIANAIAHELVSLHIHFHKSDSSPDGAIPFDSRNHIYVRTLDPSYYVIDPTALNDYQEMVQSLQARGSSVVYVVPPVYRELYLLNRASYRSYLSTMRSKLPSGPLIDFNDPEYAGITSDGSYFFDCFHLNPKGARLFTAILGNVVPIALNAGK
jgi:hypothetical protein